MPPKRPPLPRPTHFLCIPLITPSSRTQLQSSLSIFKADVSASPFSPSQCTPPLPLQSSQLQSPPHSHPPIPASAIRPPSTLHLTLHILNLSNPNKLSVAIQTLNNLFHQDRDQDQEPETSSQDTTTTTTTTPSLLSHLPLPPLTLHSLYSMHTPSSTCILYTSPLDPEKHLQIFCEAVRERFVDAGFVVAEKKRERDLLLHATIMNTIYVPRGYGYGYAVSQGMSMGGGEEEGEDSFGSRTGNATKTGTGDEKDIKKLSEQNQKSPKLPNPLNTNPKNQKQTQKPHQHQRLKFDAREILSRYADFTWMSDVQIEKVALCKMGAKKKKKGDGDEDGDEEYEVEAEVEIPWG